MAERWTIERELREAAGIEDYRSALVHVGLVPTYDPDVELIEVMPWCRGGAETFICAYEISSGSVRNCVIVKACVSSPAAGPLNEVFSAWLERRKILAGAGIEVPKLYTAHKATLIEELIPYSLRDVLLVEHSIVMMSKLGHLVGVLTRLGFPVLAFHDIRSRGEDVVWVDFGQDLGPPGVVSRDSASALEDLIRYLEMSDIELTSTELRALSVAYEQELSQ